MESGGQMAEEVRTRILLVDDNSDVTMTIEAYLEDDFDIVGTASNGKEGVELAAKLKPDVIIMDLEMPIMNGHEATRIIASKNPDTIIIVLSGLKDSDSIRAAMVAGAREYLFKPIEKDDLIEVVERLSRQQRDRRRLLEAAPKPPGAGLWCFTSPSAGVGQTTMITSIANELLTLGKSVIIADLNVVYGDVAFYMKLNPNESCLPSVMESNGYLNSEKLEDALLSHASGVRVFAVPNDIVTAVSLDAPDLIKAAIALSDIADYVLLDLAPGVPNAYVDALDVARFIFALTDDSLGGLKNLGRHVHLLIESGFPSDKVRPLYFGDTKDEPQIAVFNNILAKVGSEISQVFPYDKKTVDDSIMAGQAVTRYAPKSAYTKAVREFLVPILELSPKETRETKKLSILQRLFGG